MKEHQLVVFELSGVCYGIDILNVQEIMRTVELTRVSEADLAVEGIINLRGQIIPVINLSRRLGLPEVEKSHETRVVVVEVNCKKLGLIVDRVLEVGKYIETDIENPAGIGCDVSFLKGIVKKRNQLWLVLNINEVA